VLPLAGSEEKQLPKSVWRRNFAVVDDGIYWMPKRMESLRGAATETAPVKNLFSGITVSPDRRTILFPLIGRTGSNIIVVDNFR